MKLLETLAECNAFDNLRYHLHMNKRKTISELPPISVSMIKSIMRSHHFAYIYRNLYHPQQPTNLDSINFGWERENGLLTPTKFYKRLPVEYTVKSG